MTDLVDPREFELSGLHCISITAARNHANYLVKVNFYCVFKLFWTSDKISTQ